MFASVVTQGKEKAGRLEKKEADTERLAVQ